MYYFWDSYMEESDGRVGLMYKTYFSQSGSPKG